MTLRLPSYLDGITAGAHTQYRRRLVSWTIAEPGEIHRNRFLWAHIEVTEREPWKGEPLWVSAQRSTSTTSAVRQSFTASARDRIHGEIVPAVARYGFDRLWTELSRQPMSWRSADRARAEAAEVRRAAEWWEQKAELLDLHAEGLVEFRPVPATPIGQRGVSVRICHPHQQRFSHEQPVAEVLVAGERVGWVLGSGDLVPLDVAIR